MKEIMTIIHIENNYEKNKYTQRYRNTETDLFTKLTQWNHQQSNVQTSPHIECLELG